MGLRCNNMHPALSNHRLKTKQIMDLIDIGANLTHDSFRQDLDDVLARASAHGVGRMIVTGASREGSEHALALARASGGRLYATAGVHPHHAVDYDDHTDDVLRRLAAEPEVRAVGETGLAHPSLLVSLQREHGDLAAQVDPMRPLHVSGDCAGGSAQRPDERTGEALGDDDRQVHLPAHRGDL